MTCLISIIESLIAVSIWIYWWMKKPLSFYLSLDLQFVLKQWWALWCISKKKKTERSKLKEADVISNIKKFLNPRPDNPKIILDENSCDNISFYGADQQGNSLFVKMNHKEYRTAELILQLTLSDGQVYVLPDYPATVTTEGISQKWSASGLKIELLEPRQRWRIIYNGFLRNQCQGDISNNDNVVHTRLNFIFIGKPRWLEWPGDWSTHLHANALAHEQWKGPNWMHKIRLLDYTGFDLWGSIIGQITFKDSNANKFYLRGLCQRRWGKHESYLFHRTVTFYGVTQHGAMYYLGVSNTKHSFSHMQFGHLQEAGGTIAEIDWTDLKLSDFEKRDTIPINYKIAFTAAGKRYTSIINYSEGNAITCYNGQPWSWACTTHNLRVQLKDSTGVGLMVICYPYTGLRQIKTSVAKIQYTTRPVTFTQKDEYILHFDSKQRQNENVVGGKGYSLAILTRIITDDFTVPRGFCVTSLALERQLQHHTKLQSLIADIIDSCCKKEGDLERSCQKAVSIIQSTPVEKEIAEIILQALKELESSASEKDKHVQRYAVRSSAVGEDSEETSAAGQNSTYLGVKGANDVIECVAKCWASLFSYQSVEYRRQNGLPIRASMGVCVQRMVDAETAGVMFTRHPTTGDPSSIIITANYGLGETVVSGKVEPDTLTIHRKWDNTLSIGALVLGNKEKKISLDDDGVTTSALSKQEINKISISNTIALRLAEIGLRLESLFGSARDVEWAVIGEQIYLLQARPITTIYAWTDFEIMHELDSGVPSDVDLMTFANIGEVVPYPISPLSISTVMKVLNLSLSAKFNQYDCNYLHIVGMRCALNYLDSTLQDVEKEITMANKMTDLAICGCVVTTPETHKAAIEKYGIINIWRGLYKLYDTLKSVYTNDAAVKRTIDIYNKYELNANEFGTPQDLYNILSKKYGEIFLIGKGHNMASLTSVCYQMLAMWLLTKTSDFMPMHLADIAILLSSCPDVISTEVPIVLREIAVCIRKSGKADEFSKIESTEAMTWLQLNCPSAMKKLETFFKIHGHRCVHEIDLYTEPWDLKPDSIISTIQTLAISVEENYANKTLSMEETITSLKTAQSLNLIARFFLRKVIPLCRKAVTFREKTKNLTISTVHKLRLAYRRLGTLMVEKGYIPDKKLIFFLTHQEIGQLLNNHNPVLVRKALRRRKIHQQVKNHKYPEFSTGMPEPIEESLDVSLYEGCTKIEGTSVYGGPAIGRACVITDLSEAKNIQHGDILITHCTDIGWSPYFPLLTGIVTELGGLISHGAVVAREYGLPCIVGAKDATKVFHTGDTVLLSADVGTLQLIEKAQFDI